MNAEILCLETEGAILDLLELHLTDRLGGEVTRESTLEGAQKKLSESSYDLLTMSLAFPVHNREDHKFGFGGLTFLQELRNGSCGARASEMPVLVLSGAKNLQEMVKDSISPLGNTRTMAKPFSVVALTKLIEEILDAAKP